MRLACSDFTWRNISHHAVLDLIAALGFEGVDIGFVPTYTAIEPDEVRSKPEYWAGVLSERVRSRGLELADVYPIASMDLYGLALNHPEPSERAAANAFFDQMLILAATSGADGMTIVPGMVFDEPWDDALNRAVEGLKRRVEAAQARGVPLSIECHINSVADTPDKALILLDRVPGLGLTLDYGHFIQQGIPQEQINPLLEHTRHFHCRGCAPGVVQARFIDNVIDFDLILDTLVARPYNGWFSMEYVHDERPGAATCDVTQEVILFRDFVRGRLGN